MFISLVKRCTLSQLVYHDKVAKETYDNGIHNNHQLTSNVEHVNTINVTFLTSPLYHSTFFLPYPISHLPI